MKVTDQFNIHKPQVGRVKQSNESLRQYTTRQAFGQETKMG